MIKEFFMAIKNHWTDSAWWLIFNLLGGLLPVWGGFFAFYLLAKNPRFTDFSNNGEFALYSAAILAYAFYIILKDYKSTILKGRMIFGIFSVVLLIFTSILFALVVAVDTENLNANLNRDFMRYSSFIFYAISIILAFLLTALDKYGMQIDIKKLQKEPLTKLEDDFDKLEKNNAIQ